MSFNLRVYGLLIQQGAVLVSDENINGMLVTKFPGGGLEFGEGTKEGLAREFLEEMNIVVNVGEHFYTTDFFQESAFKKGDQIISIYYWVKALQPLEIPHGKNPFNFSAEQQANFAGTGRMETCRWIPLAQIDSADFTLPIDKYVANLLAQKKF